MGKEKNKVLIGVIIALAVIIIGLVVVIPVLLLGFGIFVFIRRRYK